LCAASIKIEIDLPVGSASHVFAVAVTPSPHVMAGRRLGRPRLSSDEKVGKLFVGPSSRVGKWLLTARVTVPADNQSFVYSRAVATVTNAHGSCWTEPF
jgi:hypothetical protein